jgi:BioD-like phosphotransacetylase family protein
MNVVYIHSDEADAGKTALAVTLADLLRREGASVAVVKPISLRGAQAGDPDPDIYEKLLGQVGGTAPVPAAQGKLSATVLGQITDSCKEAGDGRDVLIVEGSSGVTTDAARQIVEALDAAVLGITRHVHSKDSDDLAGWPSAFGDRLIGVVINGRTQYQSTELEAHFLPALDALGIKSLGVVPEDRTLVSATVEQIVQHLGGRYLQGEEYGDRVIEHFLVGGMGLDWGVLYFGIRENKTVIVRGNRPDIQMAALHTPTSCLILTNGVEPVEYIVNEADLEEVPIVVVDSNTLDTMAELNTLQDRVGFDHAQKVECFRELLRKNVDLDPIFERLGAGVSV